MKKNVYPLAVSAVTGAAYAAMTMALAPLSFGVVQLRVSEVLCILPFFMPCTSWGLFLGCAAANMLTGNIMDVVFGSLATLSAALATAACRRCRHKRLGEALACAMPVVFNSLAVGILITCAYNGLSLSEHPEVFALNALSVGLGEAAVMFIAGYPLTRYLPTKKFFVEFANKVNGNTNDRRK